MGMLAGAGRKMADTLINASTAKTNNTNSLHYKTLKYLNLLIVYK